MVFLPIKGVSAVNSTGNLMIKKSSKIYRYYYALAGLEVLTIFLALWVAYNIHTTYKNSLVENDKWAKRLETFNGTQSLIIKALEPGNAVFNNGNLKKERDNFKKISNQISPAISKIFKDAISSPDIYETIMAKLIEAKMQIDFATEDTYVVFDMYESKDIEKAATYMSKMDAGFISALKAFADIRGILSEKQKISLNRSQGNAAKLVESEILAGIIITIAVIFMIYFASKLRRKMIDSEANLNEKTENLLHMEEGLNKHAIVARTDRAGTILSVNDTFLEV